MLQIVYQPVISQGTITPLLTSGLRFPYRIVHGYVFRYQILGSHFHRLHQIDARWLETVVSR